MAVDLRLSSIEQGALGVTTSSKKVKGNTLAGKRVLISSGACPRLLPKKGGIFMGLGESKAVPGGGSNTLTRSPGVTFAWRVVCAVYFDDESGVPEGQRKPQKGRNTFPGRVTPSKVTTFR